MTAALIVVSRLVQQCDAGDGQETWPSIDVLAKDQAEHRSFNGDCRHERSDAVLTCFVLRFLRRPQEALGQTLNDHRI